jgi:hypothetical protein
MGAISQSALYYWGLYPLSFRGFHLAPVCFDFLLSFFYCFILIFLREAGLTTFPFLLVFLPLEDRNTMVNDDTRR